MQISIGSAVSRSCRSRLWS